MTPQLTSADGCMTLLKCDHCGAVRPPSPLRVNRTGIVQWDTPECWIGMTDPYPCGPKILSECPACSRKRIAAGCMEKLDVQPSDSPLFGAAHD